MNLVKLLQEYTFSISDWEVFDTRISIPPMSYGSDAINPHTQYSNPILLFRKNGVKGVGVSFTLGDGNDILCSCIKKILWQMEGVPLRKLFQTTGLFFETFANPRQLRWLSPYSGAAYMAAGAILNTLLDWAAKRIELPLWKALSLESSDNLLKFCSSRQYAPFLQLSEIADTLERGFSGIQDRFRELESGGIPVYFTTWIGNSPQEVVDNIGQVNKAKGIKHFKIKVSGDVGSTTIRVNHILQKLLGRNFTFYADANQSLDFETALEISRLLESRDFIWLEEPFAPDNVRLHKQLRDALRHESRKLEIVTGENCPNAHIAIEFIQSEACDRFQIDACRLMSISDILPIIVAAKQKNLQVVPHAGGSGLDELVLHITAFNYCRVVCNGSSKDLLTEHVGFCSRYFKSPCRVINGNALVPLEPGYINDVSAVVYDSLSQNSEIKWLMY